MATATQVTAIDGDGHIMENRGRLVELLEEPYREFRSVIMESSALVPLDGIDRNLGTRLNKGSARTTAEWIEALERGPMARTVVFPTLGLYWFWFTAWKQCYYWSLTSFEGLRFSSDVTGGGLLGLEAARAAHDTECTTSGGSCLHQKSIGRRRCAEVCRCRGDHYRRHRDPGCGRSRRQFIRRTE